MTPLQTNVFIRRAKRDEFLCRNVFAVFDINLNELSGLVKEDIFNIRALSFHHQ